MRLFLSTYLQHMFCGEKKKNNGTLQLKKCFIWRYDKDSYFLLLCRFLRLPGTWGTWRQQRLYNLAFIDHLYTLGVAVCHQAPPCPFYTQPRAPRVWARSINGLKIFLTRLGSNTRPSACKSRELTTRPLIRISTSGWNTFLKICQSVNIQMLLLKVLLNMMGLIFTILLANSADNNLMIFFLFFLENKICHFMQIISIGDNLHEISKPVFWEKLTKYFKSC